MRTLLLNTTAAVFAAASVIAPVAGASAEDMVQHNPDGVIIRPDLAQAIAKGDFRVKILPRQGYQGPLLFGNGKPPAATGLKTAHMPALLPSAIGFYPADVHNVESYYLQSAVHINDWWGESDGSTWGNPQNYEAALNESKMIHVLDQYVGTAANNRYPVYGGYWSGGGPGSYISQAGLASQAAYISEKNTAAGWPYGYSAIIHLFLPPGTDTCFDNGSGCYNPDGRSGLASFTFCAYHSYTTDSNGNVVVYTVEPYQHVGGCEIDGVLANDTASVLGHEIAETISDVVPGYGWVGEWPFNNGQEIGDECVWVAVNQTLYKSSYVTQDWYSDRYHACANGK